MVDKAVDFSTFLNEMQIPDKQGKIIIMLGPPGSGKGTISEKLADNNGFVHISTGDLIRSSEDKELKKTSSSGGLVSDRAIGRLLRKRLRKIDFSKNIIIDGFPRTVKQTKLLDSIFGKLGVSLNHCIYLEVGEETAKKRIMGRAEREGREDDKNEETIERRFKEYREKTVPIIEKYKKSRRLIKLDASQKIRDVYKEATKILGVSKSSKKA